MSKQLDQLRGAIDSILDADEVEKHGDEYRVTTAEGNQLRVRQNDRGDWGWYFESGLEMPYTPRDSDVRRIVALALL